MQFWSIYFVRFALFQQSSGLCQQNSIGNYLFGPTCEFYCNCKKREQCDNVTGECSSGCRHTWTGPGCQHQDITRSGHPHLLARYKTKWAAYAIDYNITTCSESKLPSRWYPEYNIYSPFWRVSFFTAKPIQSVIITTKQANIGDIVEGGFNITVENITTDMLYNETYFPKETRLCYQHKPGERLNLTFTVKCTNHVVGNQIRIQLANKISHLALCDVSVFGECPLNQCGPDCLTVCHCKEVSYQDKKTGNCSSGCAGRWTGAGKYCDTECDDQDWGSGCENKCGYCIDGLPCDVKSGECPNGCASGYRWKNCFKPCQHGYFGDGCKQQCTTSCKGGLANCDHVTGNCTRGCKDGWQGDRCINECTKSYYGDRCSNTSSDNCLGGYINCNHVNGHCLKGCSAGWQGDTCDEANANPGTSINVTKGVVETSQM